MTSKYFGIPFANAGDKTSIPDASQPSGDVSFQDGWTPDYAKDQATDATAKDVSRQSENYFKFTVTEALKELQEIGAKPYDALVNYPVGAMIPGSNNILYKCNIKNGPDPAFLPIVDPVGDVTGTWEFAHKGFGNGQTWQDLIGSRALGVTYTNTTGRSIFVTVLTSSASTLRSTVLTVDGVQIIGSSSSTVSSDTSEIGAIIPPGADYVASNGGTAPLIVSWKELR